MLSRRPNSPAQYFGNRVSQTDPAEAPRYQYTGQEYDPETDLYQYAARYYDASVGRFLSEDPSGFSAGDMNLYRYVGNDPVTLVNPSGLRPGRPDDAMMAAMGLTKTVDSPGQTTWLFETSDGEFGLLYPPGQEPSPNGKGCL